MGKNGPKNLLKIKWMNFSKIKIRDKIGEFLLKYWKISKILVYPIKTWISRFITNLIGLGNFNRDRTYVWNFDQNRLCFFCQKFHEKFCSKPMKWSYVKKRNQNFWWRSNFWKSKFKVITELLHKKGNIHWIS